MIVGERIRLRRLERADLSLFVSWLNDPEVRRGIMVYLPLSSDEEAKWYEDMLTRPVNERTLGIEIPEGDGWRLIGSTAFFDYNWVVRSAEFGILVGDKTVWNQGFGTETTRLMLHHGFATLNLNRIYLRVFDYNERARRAYIKAGFIHEGTQRESQFIENRYVDSHMMSVLRSEWEQNQD